MKRIISLILTMALMLCVAVPGVHAADTAVIFDQVTCTNPLYPQLEAQQTVTAPQLKATAEDDIVYLDTIEEAGAALREQLEQRLPVCEVYLAAPDYSEQQIYDIFNTALIHTGVPTQGDYLMWQYQEYSCSVSGYSYSYGYELTFSYTMTYYTSASQEATVDAAVEELLQELQPEGKDDYSKLLSIYDYICANVTYDYDHLNDENYHLQYTAYGALIDGTSVCQGYAVLFYRLALECGVDSRLIAGIGNGGAHGWNIAQLDGLYYDLDSTWDAGYTDYDYFLKCEANFGDHTRYAEYDTAEFHAAYPMGQSDYVYAPHTHSYSVVSTAPSCTQDGITTYTCDCGDSYSETTPAYGHSYVGGVCEACGLSQLTTPQIQFCYSQQQTSVRVQWTTVEGADGYQLYRSTSPDGSTGWSCVKTITDGSKNTYTNQGLTEGTTYYYKVRAFVEGSDGRTFSSFSGVKFMPAAVVFDSPYSNSSFRIRLRWQQVGSAHGYQIWRCDEGGTYRVIKTIGDRGNELTDDQGATTAYSNVGLTSGSKYTYKMRAFYITEDGGKVFGPFSDEVTVAVQPIAPTLTVSSPKAGRALVEWEAAGGADGYQVWMSEEADTGFAITKSITDGTTTSYTKYDLESGKTYYFKLRAYVEVDGKKTFGAYTDTIAITIQ